MPPSIPTAQARTAMHTQMHTHAGPEEQLAPARRGPGSSESFNSDLNPSIGNWWRHHSKQSINNLINFVALVVCWFLPILKKYYDEIWINCRAKEINCTLKLFYSNNCLVYIIDPMVPNQSRVGNEPKSARAEQNLIECRMIERRSTHNCYWWSKSSTWTLDSIEFNQDYSDVQIPISHAKLFS